MNKINLIFLVILLLIIVYYCFDNIENFDDLQSLNLENDGILNLNKKTGMFSIDPNILIDPESSITFIKNFTKNISIYRPVGSNELNNVKKLIIDEMKKIGLDIEVQSFTRNINNKEYTNTWYTDLNYQFFAALKFYSYHLLSMK
jgi:hypothetical protein